MSLFNLLFSYSSAADTASDVVNTIFFWTIFGIFIVSFILLACFWWYQKSRLNRAFENLKDETIESVVQNRSEINERFAQLKYGIAAAWRDFNANLLVYNPDPSGQTKSLQLRNPMAAEDFFNRKTMGITVGTNRLFATVPALLTGLGVLGTFVGLLMGLVDLSVLQSVDLSEASDINSKNQLAGELTSGIFGMIAGAATAFKTSVWGVLASLIFNLLEKACGVHVSFKINTVQGRINALYCHIDLTDYLQKIEKSSNNTSLILSTLAEKIGDRLQESMERVGETISRSMEESLAKVLAPALEQLANTTKDQVQQASLSSQAQLENMLESFRGSLEKSGQKQGEIVNEATIAMKEATLNMADKFHEISQDLSMSMQNMASEYSQSAKAVEESLKAQSTSAAALVEHSAQETEGMFKQIRSMIDSLNNTINEQINQHKQDSLEQKESLSLQLDEVLNKTNANLELIQQHFNDKMQAEKELAESRNQDFAKMVEHLHSMMGEAQTTFNQGNNKLLDSNQSMANDLKQLHSSFAKLGEMNERSSKNMEKAALALNASTDSFKEIANGIQKNLQAMNNEVSHAISMVTQVCNASSDNVSMLKESAHRLQDTLSGMNKMCDSLNKSSELSNRSFATLNNQFREMMDTIRAQTEEFSKELSAQMTQYHDSLSNVVNERMNEWNKQTSNYTNMMTNSIRSLGNIIEEIESITNKGR